ncbi:ABC transporter substrate-binding protein [Clostridium magnum]|uniref:Arginine-binding extracellular protein ArtP n=1 Tax=Clostridium magnum DSM 2767 TaxID=1121326 RepID=A0A161XB94_9CLOT|nr:ABC transporter substrate-binding protein [Clostridium magnum]KZL91546.1 arginine-binding extracellular protein ArtP precursor [Clostridium magnum DSM 2767]SHH47009.1 amino acid ABC transporter substrate-binding protein, PAAT family (TC 3.A.1.3.-) [Clostridium magnum DSM 2767]
MIKKSLKKFIAVALIVGSIFPFSACGNKDNTVKNTDQSSQSQVMQKIKKNGKLVLGTSADYPPYEFHRSVNGKDEIVGFDIEIAKQIAKDLGVQLEIKDMKFDGLLAALDQGNIDLIVSGMTPTEERKKNVDFSDVYYTAVQTIIVRSGDKDKIKTVDDLKGKKIGVQKGAIQEEIAKNQVSGAEAVALPKISDLVLSLKNNRVDAVILESPVATSNLSANKDLVFSDIKLNTEDAGSAIAVKKGSSDLVNEINKTLSKLKADKSIDKFVTDANNLVETK